MPGLLLGGHRRDSTLVSATILHVHASLPKRFNRYVAIGDSSTEGLDDPNGRGGYRGWPQRLAERIADTQGTLLYANLGVRGRTTLEICEQQLEQALAMRPDLATVFSGTNDILERRFDVDSVAQHMEYMQRKLVESGATVLTFTLPDLTPVMPIARWIAPRILALNHALRGATARTGAILLDFAAYPVGSDPRLWSQDRIHANADGHARIAAALAEALGLPDSDGSWKLPLPHLPAKTGREWLAAEMIWTLQYLAPWPWRSLRARFFEEPRKCRQPRLGPVEPRSHDRVGEHSPREGAHPATGNGKAST